MSVSAIFGVQITPISATRHGGTTPTPPRPTVAFREGTGTCGLMIECSSRPQKKATAHHRKTRPKKTQPWDRNRGPAVYPPLPALPPEWTLVTEEVPEEVSSSSPTPAGS